MSDAGVVRVVRANANTVVAAVAGDDPSLDSIDLREQFGVVCHERLLGSPNKPVGVRKTLISDQSALGVRY